MTTDTTPPTLTSASPADDAISVVPSANLYFTFNENVKAGTGNIVVHKSADGTAVATIAVTDTSQVSFSYNTVTVNPTNDLAGATSYDITIDSGAITDTTGNAFAGISSPTALNFLTGPYIAITTDTTLTSMPPPPAPYDHVTYAIGNGATLTLASGSNPTSIVYLTPLSGSGMLVNNANINTTGPAIAAESNNFNYTGPSVINNGSITAAVATGYAIQTGSYGLEKLVNTGSITATGGGGGVDAVSGSGVNNSGTITADGTAVNDSYGAVVNSGTIHSNNGVGLNIFGDTAKNSGTIYGKTIGVQLLGTLINSGTISSPNMAVSIDSYGTLVNAANGIVNGNVGFGLYGHTLRSKVDNAGTITGNVDFGRSNDSENTFVAQPGSVVTGNLVLGGGNDTFATSIDNTGPGAFAGVNGTVTGGGNDTLRYFVPTAVSVTALNIPTMFSTLAFDMSNNAKLTLTADISRFNRIGFSGTGAVDIAANITSSSSNPIFDLTQTSMQTAGGATVPTMLDVTSRGTLSAITANGYEGVVVLSSTSRFTNAGAITVQNLADPNSWPYLAAVYSYGGTVVNSGTITLFNADAVGHVFSSFSGELTVVNSGTITRLAGDTVSTGIHDAVSVTNTGTISTSGVSVSLTSLTSGATSSLINSGQIASATGTAVKSYYRASVTNQEGGSISGADYGVSIDSSGATVTNAGIISGGSASVRIGPSGTLILQTGSTLVGDALGSQSALVLQGCGAANNMFGGFESLDAQGPGTWTLGVALSFNTVTVSGGTLVLSGAVTSAFTVNAGSTLQGSSSTLLAQSAVTDNGTIVFDQAADGTFGRAITGSGNLVKQGSGTLTLTGGDSITGTTTVAQGSLIVQGSLAGTNSVVVNAGAAFTLDASSTNMANSVTISGAGTAILKGGSANDVLTGGAGNDTLIGSAGNDTLDGGAGVDTASYAGATGGVTVSLAIFGAQAVGGGQGADTLISVNNLTGSAYVDMLTGDSFDNVLSGGDEHDTLTGGAGNDTLDGGSNIDTAVFAGIAAAYTITQGATGVFTISGSDGTDTLSNVEYAKFTDKTVRLLSGTGTTIDWSVDPATYMTGIRDFDGNDVGAAAGWKLIGTADVNGDGTAEHILVNRQNGRWAEVGTESDGKTYFANNGWAGDTRVVGIYIDPLVASGEVVQGGDFDSQRRFQNDLDIENIHGVLGQADYNHDGLQEVYFSLTDGTAYLHAYMHADGNIQYANYQNEQQVKDYLTSNGFTSAAWAGWFPAAQTALAAVAG